MKKILVASLLLGAMSFIASGTLARKGRDLQLAASGLSLAPVVMPPEVPTSPVKQREVDDIDAAPNNEFTAPSPDSPTVQPVDEDRRGYASQAVVDLSLSRALGFGVWGFPMLGLLLIGARHMEQKRIRCLMETIERESAAPPAPEAAKEVPDAPAPPA